MALQVLSRVLSHAVDAGKLSGNPCEGIKTLYRVDRSEIDLASGRYREAETTCSPEIGYAIDLAAHTGLRLGDLVRLCWAHIGDDEIVIATGKSRGKRSARVPLYDALRAVLAAIPRRATTVRLTAAGGHGARGASAVRSLWPRTRPDLPIFISTICAGPRRRGSTWRATRAPHCRGDGMGTGACLEDHQALRRPRCDDQGGDHPTERGESTKGEQT